MYIEDLQPYSFSEVADAGVLAVGWLDSDHPFPKGEVPPALLKNILVLCFSPVNQTRGFHLSPFLPNAPVGMAVELEGKQRFLGSAEIRVSGRDGKCYAAPDLIYHYVRDCHYLPPREFLDALAYSAKC